MIFQKSLLLPIASLALVSATPISERATCSSYTLISTRGTGEAQGPSAGFRTMISQTLAAVSGGKEYDAVYPAAADQNSAAGTADIIRKVQSSDTPCYILLGYSQFSICAIRQQSGALRRLARSASTNLYHFPTLLPSLQGAAATVDAMKQISGSAMSSVKGVVLIGDPEHKAGLACNVDANGGSTTKNANGLSVFKGGVPADWVSRTLDICALGDGVCDTSSGYGITPAHLSYGSSASVQSMGAKFMQQALQA